MKIVKFLLPILLAAPNCYAAAPAPAVPGPTAGSTFQASVKLFGGKDKFAGFTNGERPLEIFDNKKKESFFVSLKLVFERGGFNRDFQTYKANPKKLQFLYYNKDYPSTTGDFKVWAADTLYNGAYFSYDLPGGRTAFVRPTFYEDGSLSDVQMEIFSADSDTLMDITFTYEDLISSWRELLFNNEMHRQSKDGTFVYLVPQTYWNSMEYIHGFVLGEGDFLEGPRGIPSDFVEVCRGPKTGCSAMPPKPADSLAAGLRFIPGDKDAWNVRNMSADELRAALMAELGL